MRSLLNSKDNIHSEIRATNILVVRFQSSDITPHERTGRRHRQDPARKSDLQRFDVEMICLDCLHNDFERPSYSRFLLSVVMVHGPESRMVASKNAEKRPHRRNTRPAEAAKLGGVGEMKALLRVMVFNYREVRHWGRMHEEIMGHGRNSDVSPIVKCSVRRPVSARASQH